MKIISTFLHSTKPNRCHHRLHNVTRSKSNLKWTGTVLLAVAMAAAVAFFICFMSNDIRNASTRLFVRYHWLVSILHLLFFSFFLFLCLDVEHDFGRSMWEEWRRRANRFDFALDCCSGWWPTWVPSPSVDCGTAPSNENVNKNKWIDIDRLRTRIERGLHTSTEVMALSIVVTIFSLPFVGQFQLNFLFLGFDGRHTVSGPSRNIVCYHVSWFVGRKFDCGCSCCIVCEMRGNNSALWLLSLSIHSWLKWRAHVMTWAVSTTPPEMIDIALGISYHMRHCTTYRGP